MPVIGVGTFQLTDDKIMVDIAPHYPAFNCQVPLIFRVFVFGTNGSLPLSNGNGND